MESEDITDKKTSYKLQIEDKKGDLNQYDLLMTKFPLAGVSHHQKSQNTGHYANYYNIRYVITDDQKYLFTIGFCNVLQHSTKTLSQINDFFRIHNYTISSIAVTSDNRYLFTSSDMRNQTEFGITMKPSFIRQIDLRKKKVVRKHNKSSNMNEISDICSTSDDKYLFSLNPSGIINQYNIKTNRLIKVINFAERKLPDSLIHLGSALFYSMKTSNDRKYLLVKVYNGTVYQFEIKTGKLVNHEKFIYELSLQNIEPLLFECTQDSKYLFVATDEGNLYQLELESQKLVKCYKKFLGLHRMTKILITADSKYQLIVGRNITNYDECIARILDIEKGCKFDVLSDLNQAIHNYREIALVTENFCL